MLASKENARKALRAFGEIRKSEGDVCVAIVRDFIESAIKRLPTEASFKRDRERRRAKAGAK